MGIAWSQWFPPRPVYTEKELHDLAGKVYIVTGSNTGVGKSVAQFLYSKNAKVYVAARSETKALDAIQAIKSEVPASQGELVYLHLDLGDLTTIKATADEFLSKETRLNVIFNNAGVMMPPQGSKTAQGYELQLGTNCIGHFLLVKLLTPTLIATAKTEPTDSVRIVWVSSSATDMLSPPGGVDLANLDYHIDQSATLKYGVSKAGNFLHATEFARRHDGDGVVSVSLNPGNLSTDLLRHPTILGRFVFLFSYPAKYGAYTEIFAGLSPEVTIQRLKKDNFIIPWGRFGTVRADVNAASKPTTEGGTGLAAQWWDWNEEQVKPYL